MSSSWTAARARTAGGRPAHHTTTFRSPTMTDPNRLFDAADRESLAELRAYLTGRPQPNPNTGSVAALRRVRAVLETEHVVGRTALEYRGLIVSALTAAEAGPTDQAAAPSVGSAVPGQTDVEDPARIDRLRPEFTEHASVEAIDAQLRRAQSQERRWHIRAEWLISLRARRVAQKERGEWPAAGAQQTGDA